jgi:hypothetical protein
MNNATRRRRQARTLKEQLPYPYNQDLSKVLRALSRRTPFARRRKANDPVTAALAQHGPGAGEGSADG